MAVRVIITHGTESNPDANWFPWLANALRAKGTTVIVPRYPTPQGQDLQMWMKTFNAETGGVTPTDILVGHSIGAAFVLRVLETAPSPVKAAVLVAGFASILGDPHYDPLCKSFVGSTFNWQKIRRSAENFVIFSGENDPYVPSVYGEEISGRLASPQIIIPGGKHLNGEAGYTKFPELLKEIEKYI